MMTFEAFYEEKYKKPWPKDGDRDPMVIIKNIMDLVPIYLDYVICMKLGGSHKL